MEHLLANQTRSWTYFDNLPEYVNPRLVTLRPMLLYFGYYRDLSGKLWKSYDKEIPKSVLIDWFRLGCKHIFWMEDKYLQELRSNVIHSLFIDSFFYFF